MRRVDELRRFSPGCVRRAGVGVGAGGVIKQVSFLKGPHVRLVP